MFRVRTRGSRDAAAERRIAKAEALGIPVRVTPDLRQPDFDYPCRHDDRCQYAIDSGAEDLGHCPRGKCVMPDL
jgi:hypothetical protein